MALLSTAVAQAPNSTVSAASSVSGKTGWQDGPNLRGTSTLVWSCLDTVFACTWSILHLNVPHHSDSTWVKIGRKAKWMLITVLFPEFIFSRAVCELQMAVDDLHAMKKKESAIKWKVDFSCGVQILHKMFHLFDNPSPEGDGQVVCRRPKSQTPAMTSGHSTANGCDPIFLPEKERVWSLTHSFFANMGGLERYTSSQGLSPLTAHALVNCCAGSDHDPLPTLDLPKEDIDDKSKSDWFLKFVAVTQISWFLVSVIVRAADMLPISQLEICTSAFTILAIATYGASWSKPKDVGVAVRFKIFADTHECEAYKYHAESFYYRLSKPSKRLVFNNVTRIRNDFVRLEGFMPPMAITMAISTTIFGGIHCSVWNFEFPTETERMIWMGLSVASATIPTAALFGNMIIVGSIRRAIRKHSGHLSKNFEEWKKEWYKGSTVVQTRRQGLIFTRQQHSRSPETEPSTEGLVKKLLIFENDLQNFTSSGIQHRKVFASYKVAFLAWRRQDRLVSNVDSDLLRKEMKLKLLSLGLRLERVDYIIYLMQDLGIMLQVQKELEKFVSPRDKISIIITIISGTLYAIVRMMLLALAFAALRSVPEGVYVTTWTRFFPNIS